MNSGVTSQPHCPHLKEEPGRSSPFLGAVMYPHSVPSECTVRSVTGDVSTWIRQERFYRSEWKEETEPQHKIWEGPWRPLKV